MSQPFWTASPHAEPLSHKANWSFLSCVLYLLSPAAVDIQAGPGSIFCMSPHQGGPCCHQAPKILSCKAFFLPISPSPPCCLGLIHLACRILYLASGSLPMPSACPSVSEEQPCPPVSHHPLAAYRPHAC